MKSCSNTYFKREDMKERVGLGRVVQGMEPTSRVFGLLLGSSRQPGQGGSQRPGPPKMLRFASLGSCCFALAATKAARV